MIEGLPGSSQPGADTTPTTSTPNHLPGSDASFPTPVFSSANKPKFPLFRSALVTVLALFASSLILSAFGVFAFLDPVSDFLAGASGIKDSVLREIIDPVTKKIPLTLLPTGHNSDLDADTLDTFHADAFAMAQDLDKLATTVGGLQVTLSALEVSSSQTTSSGVTTLNNLSGDIKLVGGSGVVVSQSGNTLTFQATSSGGTTGVTSLTGGGGITVSSGTGAVTLGTSGIPYSALSLSGGIVNADISASAQIAYSKLSLAGTILSSDILDGTLTNADLSSSANISYSKLSLSASILGSDLSSGINISTSGNLATTGSGTISSAGLLTAGNGLSITSGNLTVAGTAIFNNSGAASTKTNIDSSGNILPGANNSGTLGSAGLYWNNVFTNTLTANSISATTSGIAGTTSATFTVNTDNATNDLEDMDLIFFRGTASPNGLLSWKQALDTFELNFPLSISGALSATGATLSGLSTAGVVHNSAAGILSTSLIVNADVSSSAAIAYSKLGLTNSIVNADIASTAAIGYTKLSLTGSLVGGDLASNISISTTGNLVTTSSGIITSAGAFSGPTATNTINGLVINAGALSGITTLSLSGAITGATSTNTINGLVFSSGNATLANLTSSSGTLTTTVADGATAVGFVLGTSTTYSTAGAKLLSLKNNTVEEFAIDKDGNLTVNGNIVATGTIQGTQLISTVLTGTAPLVVSSTTQVANLNASFIEGYNAATLMSQPQPNLVLNSDFGRRNKWMTFMPEVFADTSGWTAVQGTLGTVSTNILTAGTATGPWSARAGLSTWRDVRYSGQFKKTQDDVTSPTWEVVKWVDANNWVAAVVTGGQLRIYKNVAGTTSQVGTGVAASFTTNNWYWLELEVQGTVYITKVYNSGASPVAKSSATLLNTKSETISDSAFTSGGYIMIAHGLVGGANNSVASQWGGLNSGDGGVYVEGWGPESWDVTFGGTLGGQAIGFDETADAGPLGKQWSVRGYVPATNRQMNIKQDTPDGSIVPSASYLRSGYLKTSGKGGTGSLLEFQYENANSALAAFYDGQSLADAGETAWTRKTGSASTSNASARRARLRINWNPLNTASGTAWVQLPQLEQGSLATPWRNAPADDGPIVWRLRRTVSANLTTTGATPVAMDERDLAGNIFIPWDARLLFSSYAGYQASNGQYRGYTYAYVDGSNVLGSASMGSTNPSGGIWENAGGHAETLVSAGKRRVALFIATDGGASATWQSDLSGNYDDNAPMMIVTAMRGK